jgi:hypothetical protein
MSATPRMRSAMMSIQMVSSCTKPAEPELTARRPPVWRNLAVAENEHDEHEARGDEESAEPVDPAVRFVSGVPTERWVRVN